MAASVLVCPLRKSFGSALTWFNKPLDSICHAQHYVYLVPLLVPVTAWFAIANWVGWEYFRYA
jgi:hypothetical protein